MDHNPSFIRSKRQIDMPGFGLIQDAVMRKIFEEVDKKDTAITTKPFVV
jgi:hypothetical protein